MALGDRTRRDGAGGRGLGAYVQPIVAVVKEMTGDLVWGMGMGKGGLGEGHSVLAKSLDYTYLTCTNLDAHLLVCP